jgi:flagellar export protein FliJ
MSAWRTRSQESKRLQRIDELPKFTYSLETLLRYKEEIEDRERDALHRLTYKYQLEDSIRNRLAAKFQETMQDIVEKYADKFRDEEMSWFHLYLNRLTSEIGECEKRLVQLQSEIKAQKEALIEASKNRKTLASMKAKKEKEFFAEQEKREQKEIDDLVVTRYARLESGRQSSAEILGSAGAAIQE